MSTDSRPATTEVPALSDDLAGLFEALRGFHAGVDQILDGYRLICLDRHDRGASATLVTILGGDFGYGVDITGLQALVIERLTDPATNPALRDCTPDAAREARKCGRAYAALDADEHTDFHTAHAQSTDPRRLASEAAHHIGNP